MTKQKQKLLFWVGVVIALLFGLSLVSSIMLPFVVGAMVAYFLDPAADRLEKAGCSRVVATSIIIAGFFSLVLLAVALLLPVLYDQLMALIRNIPGYINAFQIHYGEKVNEWLAMIDQNATVDMSEKAMDASRAVLAYTGKVAGTVWESGVALLNLLSLLFISPVVAFYMLRDFDRIKQKVDGWFPRSSAATIRGIFREMDATLAGFIRGMSNVCLSMAAFYALGFTLVGLEFGLLIGIGAGLLTFVPFVGPVTAYTVAIAVALFQFDGDMVSIGMVGVVCALGQMLESNLLTPTLVGGKINVHPVWIIFGLLAGGSLFGFVGVLLAVPLTAIVGVLARFAIGEYLKSGYYKGKKVEGRR